MRANRAFHLIVSRERREPVFLAGPERQDRIEIVSIDDGEVVLFWELPAKPAAKLAKALRTDLAGLDADEFLARWDDASAAP
jgi:hypothetical protein